MTDIIGLIKKHLNNRFKELQTAEVVIVEAVDYTTWTCSVRPKAKIAVHGKVQEMPQIMSVPISVQKAGNSVILMPIKVGDVCLCVFSKYALDNLLIDHATNTITIPRMFDINDCILIAGVYTGMETVPAITEGETLVYNQSGSYIKFFENGNMKIYANGNIEIKADRVDINS